ncbi:competence type IV pilus assembly protein ComGB [Bacillus sp. B1-b2]|uniref:competence type IV pilus assembly protein ComGB n=1 Tax=Bacillus sp. B1-b2 TaxID=2653201 RepID=UPI001D027B57|nr:competence type IV pilus assembly protein ComGB [Bacillus sp. B1-b2]
MKRKAKSWSLMEQSQFLKCLGELLDRGYSVAEAVQSATYYMPPKRVEDIKACYGSLKGGDSFFDNLTRLNFDQQVISFVFFAEKHGGFSSAFQDASKMIQNKYETVGNMKKLLSYPLFLLFFTFILLFFVQSILIPRFNSIFASMDLESNFFMKIVQVFHFLLPFCFFCILICFLLIILYYYLHFQKLAVMKRINLLVGLPVIGSYVMQYYSYIFTLQLSYLLASGFSMYESLLFFQENKQQRLYAEVGATIIFQLRKGVKLEKALNSVEFLDKELSRIIQHGQENGKLDQELYYYGSHCLKQMEENLSKTMKMIQPALYTFIGVLIISIYLSVLLPMFQLLNGL